MDFRNLVHPFRNRHTTVTLLMTFRNLAINVRSNFETDISPVVDGLPQTSSSPFRFRNASIGSFVMLLHEL